MRGVLFVERARSARKFFGHAYFSENHAHCVRIRFNYRSVDLENLYQGEIKNLLATIIVREGILLIYNRDFFSIRAAQVETCSFRHIGGVVLGGGGGFVRTKRTTPGSATVLI